MLRPAKFLTVLLACCLLLLTFLLLASSPSSTRNNYYTPRRRASPFLSFTETDATDDKNIFGCQPPQARTPPTQVTRPIVPEPSFASTSNFVDRERSGAHGQGRERDSTSTTPPSSLSSSSSTGKQVEEGEPRYLMYVPYAGVTNQLISIWHGSLIAKALNRTLLIPNLSPNVHVEVTTKDGEHQKQEPAPTKWSEFFDLDYYSQKTGLKVEELDTFLTRRGVVEKESMVELRKRRKRSLESSTKKRINRKKRWIQLVQEGHPISGAGTSESTSTASALLDTIEPEASTLNRPFSTEGMVHRPIQFPAVQKCFSEAGYGADRRIDMTGRRFMERYGIDSELIPTPYLDPERDNATIWARWRMDKVIERYQQPAYENEEVLCLGHVYRLLPGGNNRAWVEFGQHFRFTDGVDQFVDEILETLLASSKQGTPQQELASSPSPFVGIHLRRGDFHRHCLGITSPADPNGWNRCYPSTEHIISLLSKNDQELLSISSSPSLPPSMSSASTPSPSEKPLHQLPVLVLTNEHDPEELAKADEQNWIGVDHHKLGTLERFGRYGPILIDGALLARASLLVGVEYSTYFRTASKRAESWYGGKALFVT